MRVNGTGRKIPMAITTKILNMNTYQALHDLVQHHITDYRDDLLVIDKRFIEMHPGVPFLHWTRQWGTHCSFLHPADDPIWPAEGVSVPYLFATADRRHILKEVESCAQYHHLHGTPSLAVHYFDGRRIVPITTLSAWQIAQEYVNSVRNQWNNAFSRRFEPRAASVFHTKLAA